MHPAGGGRHAGAEPGRRRGVRQGETEIDPPVPGTQLGEALRALRKMPTDTGSTCTGPTPARRAMTASKMGRSCAGPEAKYSSTLMAGAHS